MGVVKRPAGRIRRASWVGPTLGNAPKRYFVTCSVTACVAAAFMVSAVSVAVMV